MAETQLHRSLVSGLVGYLRGQGVTVTAAAGETGLPDPGCHGRHEPDAEGTKAGVVWLGEAKTDDGDLESPHSLEQYYDFSHRYMPSTKAPCPFVLCVPKGHAERAYAALRKAGAAMDRTVVIS